MKVITDKELEKSGISVSEAQKSLTLVYLDKKFIRKSDVPKKFRDTALNICNKIYEMGKESFVTETNYSYTIWEEEQKSNNTKKILKTTATANTEKDDKPFSSSPYSLKNFITQ